MNLGDTFTNMARPGIPTHLWFVVSHPTGAGRVVLVNISSDDDGLGDLETLVRGDHPWLAHDSFIRTDRALLATVASLQAGLAANPPVVIPREPATPAALEKLQRALRDSRHTRREIKGVLQEQGLPRTLGPGRAG